MIGIGELAILGVIGFFVCGVPVLTVLGIVIVRGLRVRDREARRLSGVTLGEGRSASSDRREQDRAPP